MLQQTASGSKVKLAGETSVSVGLSTSLKHFSLLGCSKIEVSAKKKSKKGKGKGGKETLARKPHDFEKPVRLRTEYSDWRDMVVLIDKACM